MKSAMAKPKYSIGFSPCPNDTFIFYALLNGRLPACTFDTMPAVLEDVETLNLWALKSKLDITKLSFHALGHVLDDYVLLDSGSALGRGCGPLLVTGADVSEQVLSKKIAVPGRYTTAAMLMRLCYPQAADFVEMRFDQIMPAIVSGEVDAGVIIHESRFTYKEFGLQLIKDLGSWWEDTTGFAIPLGGIVAKRSLGEQKIKEISAAIKASVQWAFSNPAQCQSYIKQYAQELDEQVIAEHIKLYVNDFSVELGQDGRKAVHEFLVRGRDAGVFSCNPANVLL